MTFEQQKERFAEFILTNAFAIYAGWAGDIISLSNAASICDFDLYTIGDGTSSGLSAFIKHAPGQPSVVMQNAFVSGYMRHRKVNVLEQDNMLKCYKYFEEL